MVDAKKVVPIGLINVIQIFCVRVLRIMSDLISDMLYI